MKKIILALLLAGGAGSLSAAPVVVYDGSLTPGGMVLAGARIFTNSGKSWIYAPASVNAYTVVTGGGGYTTLNTGTGASGSPAEGVAAGFATLGGMALNSSSGYTLTVNLKTNGESHSGNPAADGPNRAGFSLTLIGSDRTKSIEIAFWRDQVWVQTGTANGETIFKHGESAAIDTASDFHEYNIVVQGDYYTIYNGQEFLLTGLLRDYSSSSAGFNGVAVYQTANFFFMGDNTTSAGGSYSFKNVLFDTDVNFYQLTGDGNQLSIHDALALPGVEYATALDHNATWLAQNGGTVSGSGNSVSNSGTNAAYGLLATGGQSVIVGADLLVRTTNSGTNLHGVVAEDFGSVALAGGTVTTAGDVSHGLFAGSGGLIAADGVTVTVGGADADAIFAQGGTVSGVNLTLNGGVRALAQGEVTLAGGSVIVSATAPAVTVSSGGAVTLQDVDLQAGGAAAELRGGTLTVSGGTLNVSGSQVFLVDASGGGALTVSNSASITNGADKILLTATNSGTFDFTISNADLGGDIVAKDAAVTVYLQNYAHLRGAIDPVDLDIQAGSRWTVTGNSTVGALANSGSVIFAGGATVKTLRAAGLSGAGAFVINVLDDLSANDQIIVSGSAGGTHHLIVSNTNASAAGKDVRLEVVYVGADSDAQFTGKPELGMFQYDVLRHESGTMWYIGQNDTPVDPGPPPVSPTGSVVLGMEGSQSLLWFAQLDSLTKRMGETRLGRVADGDWLDNVWLRGYGSQINAGDSVSGRGFSVQLYGFDAGTDKSWRLSGGHTLTLGGFAGYGRGDHDFHINGSAGETDNAYGGLYGSWLHRDGWYADVVGKVQSFANQFTSNDENYRATRGDYDNWGFGVSAELGRQFTFADGWFAEPQLQIAYAHLTNSDYWTTGNNVFNVSQGAADVWQFRVGAQFGRTIELKNGGVLQPYVKVSGVEQISGGGSVTASGTTWRPNLDGARAEIGFGLVWQINAGNQLHLDYEAAFGDKYDKPWGVNAGYRYRF